eukprot:GHVU01037716.1.p1 GENE.GHVU01037716.1~~GHVU01037716.1.p1  ORF type:complete len:104 (-),score=2.48 GHVU01037716.1:205-516(-)
MCTSSHQKPGLKLTLVTLKRYGLDQASLLRFYVANIRPALCYAAPAWYYFLGDTLKDRLEKVQRHCFRIMYTDMSYSSAISLSGVPTLKDFMNQQCVTVQGLW